MAARHDEADEAKSLLSKTGTRKQEGKKFGSKLSKHLDDTPERVGKEEIMKKEKRRYLDLDYSEHHMLLVALNDKRNALLDSHTC